MKKLILASAFMLFAVFSFANNGERINPLEIEATVLIDGSDLCSITEGAMYTSMKIPAAPDNAESQEAWCGVFCWYCCRSCITVDGTKYCTEWECCGNDSIQGVE